MERFCRRRAIQFLCLSLTSLAIFLPPVPAEDIDGVQPAAIDQPRINLIVRRTANGPPLIAKGFGEETFHVEAFLDTGASGIVLSSHTADALGINREKSAGHSTEVRFNDVGVGGASPFAVSEPIFLSMAATAPNVDIDQADAIASSYSQSCGPLRAQIGPLDSGGNLLAELALGDLDVAGMPAMQGKIIVLDTKEVNTFTDKIRTYIYDPAAAGIGSNIPKTSLHVRLSYVSFRQFTRTIPATADGPAVAANPMIGPDPLAAADNAPPPVVACQGARKISGTWLLDTGAAASMISQKQAAALGVRYAPRTYGTDNPSLQGVPAAAQFVMSVGGIGGMKKSAGFFLDKLSLMTIEGKPINFLHAPVLVADITVKDAAGRELTLDGVFGMNFLVSTAKVDESSLVPDIDHLTAGAFRYIVFDQPAGILGLQMNP